MKYTLNLSDGTTASMDIIDPSTTIELELVKLNNQLIKRSGADQPSVTVTITSYTLQS